AIDTAARLPVKEAQQDLAGVVLSAVKPELRVQAAAALVRHIQRFGPVLTAAVVQRLTDLAAAADTPPELKVHLAAVTGPLKRPPARGSGRMIRFQPPAAAPAPPPAAPPGTTPPPGPPAGTTPPGGEEK